MKELLNLNEETPVEEIARVKIQVTNQQIDLSVKRLLAKYKLNTENLKQNGYELVIETNIVNQHYTIKLCKVIDRVDFEIGFKI